MTRLRLDMMISRHALAAIAIPSLRSLQIWVVPPKHTPRFGECVFYDMIRILPSDAIAPRSEERGKGRNKKQGAAFVPNSLFFLDRFKPTLEAVVEIEGLEPTTSAM